MGCVSSAFLEDEDGIVTSGISHHIVSLNSTTYGLLTTLDQQKQQEQQTPLQTSAPPHPPTSPPPPINSTRATFTPLSEPEVINSWELMAGLDSSVTPFKAPISSPFGAHKFLCLNNKSTLYSGKENVPRALVFSPSDQVRESSIPKPLSSTCDLQSEWQQSSLDMFGRRCPLGGENAVILYTTTLRMIRKTFEDCNSVRSTLEGLGVCVRERDVSMDWGFREELRELMKEIKQDHNGAATVPRLFVKGRYIGGAEEILRIHEEGTLSKLVEGLPKVRCRPGGCCEGCGGARFLPCFQCSGSRKVVVPSVEGEKGYNGKVVRCPECNENGLVLCPICS